MSSLSRPPLRLSISVLPRWFAATLCVCWLGAATPALANLCDKPATARARREASLLLAERFSTPNSTYGGDDNYNARIITCNRDRDTNGNEIEKDVAPNHVFPADLAPRVVKGHFNYFGLFAAGLRYAYQIERSGNVWTVTVPMRFHWPENRLTGSIDISGDLATKLGLSAPGQICDPAKVKRSVDGTIIEGFIRLMNTGENIQSVGANDVGADDSACRISRSLSVGSPSKNVLQHLQEYFRDEVSRVWYRSGFRIKGIIINPQDPGSASGTFTAADLTAWEKDETVWDLYLNLDPSHRASYKRWTFKWNHMYSGAPGWVIGHEFGHVMGLDDEYGEKASPKDCFSRRPKLAGSYLMCSSAADAAGAQGVYVWLVTRRAAIADTRQCVNDNDCGDDQFCALNGLNRNACEERRREGESCTDIRQCVGGLICEGAPLGGRCITPASVGLGGDCIKDAQCTTGSCNSEGACQCRNDNDCDGDDYCDEGTVKIGQNECRPKKADDDTCDLVNGGRECRSGKCKLSRCYTPGAVGMGDSCYFDDACDEGKCSSIDGTRGTCVCQSDSDCDPGEWCDAGLDAKTNACRAKLDKGQSCGKQASVGNDHKCKSNQCSGFPNYKCK